MIKSGDVRAKFVASVLGATILATPFFICAKDYMTIDEKVEMINRLNSEFSPVSMIERKRQELKEEDEMNKKIENKKVEIAEYLGSQEYKKREYTRELRMKTGLPIENYKKYIFELSFYSDLNCENGYGNLTANGETLSQGMIANNFLPFNTMVYLEGYGTKRVTDRGSRKYFNAVNKADVFVPRISGESDSEYYRRVNNMGRVHVSGYILKLGDD